MFSNDTVQTYSSVQYASGNFTVAINSQNYTGLSTGHGTITVITTGFCSGKATVAYTYTVTAEYLQGVVNFTFAFSTPVPANVTVPLSCTGPMNGVSTATNDPIPFLPEYPGLVSTAMIPVTIDQHPGANTSYYCRIVQTS